MSTTVTTHCFLPRDTRWPDDKLLPPWLSNYKELYSLTLPSLTTFPLGYFIVAAGKVTYLSEQPLQSRRVAQVSEKTTTRNKGDVPEPKQPLTAQELRPTSAYSAAVHQLPALELWWVHLVEYRRFTLKEITKLKFCVHTQVQRYIYAKIRDQKLVVITQELITLVLCWFSCFCFFETRFFVQPWLGWNFLCRPG